MSTIGNRHDARTVALRSLGQGAAVAALTGAAAAVAELAGPVEAIGAGTVATTALAGAAYAVAAYLHKRLDGALEQRRRAKEDA